MEEAQAFDTQGQDNAASQQAPQTEVETQTQQTEAHDTATQEQVRKWKLKVYGEEKEYTEPEVLKLAQLGGAGQKAMEKAAAIEKKQREFYGWLRGALEKDPHAVAEVITGKKFQAQQAQSQEQEQTDPRDMKVSELESQVSSLMERLEAQDVEKERQLIEKELGDAVSKYPELDNTFLKSYVKQEYRKALQNGLEDLSIDDVAFYVAQQWKETQAKKVQTAQQKFEDTKQKAPVTTKPAQGSGAKKPMSLEDVKKLAGRV